MTKLYKLTDSNGNTQNNTHWEVGVTRSVTSCDNPQLCTNQVIHAYKNINLAFLLNPSHANFKNPLVFECNGEIVVEDYGKVGCFSLKITKKLYTPKWINSKKANDVKILFAILCAEQVISIYENKYPNDDRPQKAIQAAKDYLKLKTQNAAAIAAAHAAAYAADAAAHATVYAKTIDFCKLADIAVKQIMESR